MISTAVVPERCAAGAQCAGYDKRGKRPAYTEDRPLCAACLARAAADVPKLALDWVDLEQHLPPTISRAIDPDTPPGRSRGELPDPPYRLAVDALQREIQHVTTTWEHVLRDVDHLADEVNVGIRPGYAVAQAVRVLAPRTDLLATIGPVSVYPTGPEDPETVDLTGADALLAMTGLHTRARAICGLTNLTHHLPGACPVCGTALILDAEGSPKDTIYRRPNGSETVYCVVCESRRTWDDYQRYVTMEVWTRGQA